YDLDEGTTVHNILGILRREPHYYPNLAVNYYSSSQTVSLTFTAPQENLTYAVESQEISSYDHWFSIDNFKLTTEASEQVHGAAAKTVLAYKYRREDVRLGRFMSVDPLYRDYPWNSPYAFSENRVVDGVDLE